MENEQVEEMKAIKELEAERIVREFLIHIGENPDREGLKDTPKRVVKMWGELYRGYNEPEPSITTFKNGSDGIVNDEMIGDTGSFNSWCEHHTALFTGTYWFAYIPHPKGKLIGLSKVARVVDHFSSRLQIQERLTHQIVDYLWNVLNHDKYPPLGMALVLEAEHSCKFLRGVKKKGKMRTTKLVGVFKKEHETRQEFLGWVRDER